MAVGQLIYQGFVRVQNVQLTHTADRIKTSRPSQEKRFNTSSELPIRHRRQKTRPAQFKSINETKKTRTPS